MKEIKKIKILDYTEYPGPRYKSQGLDSGEDYYLKILKVNFEEALKGNSQLIVDLDDTAGYPPSFIDEIFGNLVYDFDYEVIIENIKIISDDEPDWKELVEKNIWPKWKQKKDDGQPRKPSEF